MSPKRPDDEEESEDTTTEYAAFEDLTRKLVTVSKKDLDEARASEEQSDKG
jgi:hypothetical protein